MERELNQTEDKTTVEEKPEPITDERMIKEHEEYMAKKYVKSKDKKEEGE